MTLSKIQELQLLITALDVELSEFMDSSPSVSEACAVLIDVNLLKRDLSLVYDFFATSVGHVMGDTESVLIEGGGEVEKKSSYDRKGWQHKEIGSAVADKIVKMSVDMDTGEVMKTPREIAIEMLSYCAPSYWRIKELSKIGINPDNYCEVGELKTSIIVRKPKNK